MCLRLICRSPQALLVLLMLAGAPAVGNTETARELYELGESAFARRDYPEAVQRFRDALELNEAYMEARLGLARSYAELDELDAALDAIDEARRRAGRRTDVVVLQGELLVRAGELDAAREVFEEALSREPNNTSARIGLAELAVAKGQAEDALRRYRNVLELAPQNRRALLSLAIVHHELGRIGEAARYIRLALDYHQEHPGVHILASEYFLTEGEYQRAAEHAETATRLDPGAPTAWELLAKTELAKGQPEAAVAHAEEVIDRVPDETVGFYLLGVALRRAGSYSEAIDAFERLLEIDVEDEIARLNAEAILLEEFDLEDERRQPFAEYRFDRGASLREENLFRQALGAYRRGLMLSPFDESGRRQFAELHRSLDHRARYLRELELMQDLGMDDQQVRDAIDIYTSVLAQSVSVRWGVDQYELARDRTELGLFYEVNAGLMRRPDSAWAGATSLRDALRGYEKVDVREDVAEVRSMDEAMEAARDRGLDYFGIVDVQEGDRHLSVELTLYHGRSGEEIETRQALRSGTRRVERAMYRLGEQLVEQVPARGRIIDREGRRALVSLGRRDGIEEGEVLHVVRRGRVVASRDRIGLQYGAGDELGTLEVERVDDVVAEGVLQQAGFFDLFSIGDTVIQELPDRLTVREDRVLFPPVYDRIRVVD